MRAPAGERPPTAGPDSGPEPPFPLRLAGPVIKGFARGSKELGIPTANLPIEGVDVAGNEVESGVYFGFASLLSATVHPIPTTATTSAAVVYPMVMSIGWNPYYKNSVRSVEIHIINKFDKDFYGSEMRICVLGYIRPEYDYVSREALIDDIHKDIDVGLKSLEREAYRGFREDEFLLKFEGLEDKKLQEETRTA